MAFHVGQKVVCVDAGGVGPYDDLSAWPHEKEIYTIRALGDWGTEKGPWLLLNEIVNRPLYGQLGKLGHGRHEPVFSAHRFRPVVERKTDISAFTALLNPANHRHLEGV